MNIKNTKTKILDLDLKGCLYLNHFSHQQKIAHFFKVIKLSLKSKHVFFSELV